MAGKYQRVDANGTACAGLLASGPYEVVGL
jgi:hypothetical protein